jgi:hypothetical protein
MINLQLSHACRLPGFAAYPSPHFLRYDIPHVNKENFTYA